MVLSFGNMTRSSLARIVMNLQLVRVIDRMAELWSLTAKDATCSLSLTDDVSRQARLPAVTGSSPHAILGYRGISGCETHS